MAKSEATHKQLWRVAKVIEGTYSTPANPDCFLDHQCYSCKHYHPLAGDAGADWGVCVCAGGPRAGLLCFEHMGCEGHVYG